MATYNMPSHLTGEMADLWNEVKAQVTDPATAVKVDLAKEPAVSALAAVGGCTFEKVEDGLMVTLLYAPEEQAADIPQEPAVSKPHKFAQRPQ